MTGVDIVPSQSDHLEVDELEENLARLGRYGAFSEVPVANSARSVYFVAPTAQGDGDGSTAGNALAGTYNVISANGTADVQDVFVFLKGTYDFNGATSGLAFVAGVKAFGLGAEATLVVNSNAAATAVMTDTVGSCEIGGFVSNEATNTVEFYVLSGNVSGSHIHDNYLRGVMENGIHLSNTGTRSVVENNYIYLCTNDGIEISGTCTRNDVFNNKIGGVGDNGINLNGDDVDNNHIHDNKINGHGGTTDYGIQILLGDSNMIYSNWMVELGTAPTNDTGSTNGWDDNHADEYTGTFNRTVAQGVGEVITDVQNLDLWTSGKYVIEVDVNALDAAAEGGLIQAWPYTKTDGTNYRKGDGKSFLQGVDSAVRMEIEFSTKGGDSVFQLGFQTSIVVTVNRAVYWRITQAG